MNPIDIYRARINQEALDTLEYLGEELSIPPMLSCLQMGGFCFSNIMGYYSHHNIDPPPEFVSFMTETFPAMFESLDDTIKQQFLLINTEGTA